MNNIICRVKEDLKGYKQTKRNIEAWTREKAALGKSNGCVFIPSPRLDGLPGGAADSSSVERAAIHNEKRRARIEALESSIMHAEYRLFCIDNALTALDEFDANLLRRHLIEGVPLSALVIDAGYSERSLRTHEKAALACVGAILYPAYAPTTGAIMRGLA